MDPLHSLSRQLDRFSPAADGAASWRVEAAEAVPDPQDLVGGDAVVREGEDDVLDDVVEAFFCFFVWKKKGREKKKKKNVSFEEKKNPVSRTPSLLSFSLSLSLSKKKKDYSPGQSPPQVTMAAVVVAGSA